MSETLAKSFNAFGLQVFKKLPHENCFFSPFSIAMALSALLPGAKGETFKELSGTLHTEQLSASDEFEEMVRDLMDTLQTDTSSKLFLANGLFLQKDYSILDSYREALESYFRAEVATVDFRLGEAKDQINQWVEQKTNRMIKRLLQDLPEETKLVLANAIYFKAHWLSCFDKEFTRKQSFYLYAKNRRFSGLLRTDSVPVDMMNKASSFLYMKNDRLGFEALDLPYEDRSRSLLIILPKKRKLAGVEQVLDLDLLREVRQNLTINRVHLELPRLEMDCRYNLNKVLREVGLRIPYSIDADFSGITDDPEGLMISKAIHQARLELDEKGTEAAAATAIMMEVGCALRPTPEPRLIPFIVNRPFLFILQDSRTGAILFIGRVLNPEEMP